MVGKSITIADEDDADGPLDAKKKFDGETLTKCSDRCLCSSDPKELIIQQ